VPGITSGEQFWRWAALGRAGHRQRTVPSGSAQRSRQRRRSERGSTTRVGHGAGNRLGCGHRRAKWAGLRRPWLGYRGGLGVRAGYRFRRRWLGGRQGWLRGRRRSLGIERRNSVWSDRWHCHGFTIHPSHGRCRRRQRRATGLVRQRVPRCSATMPPVRLRQLTPAQPAAVIWRAKSGCAGHTRMDSAR
jgi:hypothetical protein